MRIVAPLSLCWARALYGATYICPAAAAAEQLMQPAAEGAARQPTAAAAISSGAATKGCSVVVLCRLYSNPNICPYQIHNYRLDLIVLSPAFAQCFCPFICNMH